MVCGPRSIVDRNAIIEVDGGSLTIGADAEIGRGAMILTQGGVIKIGDCFSLNPYSIIYGHGGVAIGDFVRIAAHVVIVPSNHLFDDPDKPIRLQGYSKKGIKIGDDVWIGAHATILDGSHIGDGCVIAAGSVVRGRLEPYGVYAGVPVKLIRSRKARAIAHENVSLIVKAIESPDDKLMTVKSP